MTAAVTVAQSGSPGVSLGFKNRIINGGMMIDQRNAGAAITPTNGQYSVDRMQCRLTQASKFAVRQVNGVDSGASNYEANSAPNNFVNSLKTASLSAYSIASSDAFTLGQSIEGLNVADLGWGTSSAQPITLSFWVKSSLTGTFGGALRNSATTRSYPYSYLISAANTWEQKTVTIAGDTSGTWLKDSGVGINVLFSLGSGSTLSGTSGSWASANYTSATGATSVVGTNGATFYITGVQLEKGSTATSFDYRPYGTELALCQRYYEKSYDIDVVPGTASDNGVFYMLSQFSGTVASPLAGASGFFCAQKRTAPTVTLYSPTSGASGKVRDQYTGDVTGNVYKAGSHNFSWYCNTGGSTSTINIVGHWTASAEL